MVLLWRWGLEPFADGVRSAGPGALALAVVVTGVTTVCAARRWSVIAHRIGVPVRLGTAVAAYYRSQFLNVTLPGGILGDLHRAVDHGRSRGQVGAGVRAVAWERTAGQVVQIVLSIVVLLAVSSPVQDSLPRLLEWTGLALIGVAIAGWLTLRRPGRPPQIVRSVLADLRSSVLTPGVWPWVITMSAVAAVGHVALFVAASLAVDSTASVGRIVPVAIIVVLASALPLNVAGWGPREGVAAWAFGAAGMTSATGLAASVAYGVMVAVATLPGAVVLLRGTRRHTNRQDGEPKDLANALPAPEVVHV